ncbi:MAG TPA: PDZ domain-containing protein, partial [Gemmataceae bacterium]|nr:PDZ domain-containing protein [Gemmataceae bacterium]
MTARSTRTALGLVALFLGALLLARSPSDALAQRKGGGAKDGRAKEKEKDVPPPKITLPDSWVKALTWRCIGPANMGGRITSVAVYDADPSTYWIATASGGLVKTTNNGVTFEHQFDREATVSIGDVCVAPSDKNIVWVGTGENNPRNSVSFGDGVYKSTDGGKKWTHMGLKKTFQVGKILIHPNNPDTVYVGALGRLYGPNEDRGLYKTTDGGKTWDKVFYVDDKTGVIDMRMDPTNPDTIYVAMWERRRDEYDSWPGGGLPDGYDAYDPVVKWGKGAGIYKTADAGKSFKKLTDGLPTCNMGRIGLDIYRKDPKTLFAIIDCEKIGMGSPPKKAAIASNADIGVRGEDVGEDGGARVLFVIPEGPGDKAGIESSDVITKIADKNIKAYQDVTEFLRTAKVGDKVKVDLKRGDRTETVEVVLGERPQGKGGFGGGGGGG